jgi:hypothetical protein
MAMAILKDTDTDIAFHSHRSRPTLITGGLVLMSLLCVCASCNVYIIASYYGDWAAYQYNCLFGIPVAIIVFGLMAGVVWHFAARITHITFGPPPGIITVTEQGYTITGQVEDRSQMQVSLHDASQVQIGRQGSLWTVKILDDNEEVAIYSGRNGELAQHLAAKLAYFASGTPPS